MGYQDLTEEEQFIYGWQYGMLGGFNSALIQAISRADGMNLESLRRGFPVEVGAYLKYSREEGWWESVQRKAK